MAGADSLHVPPRNDTLYDALGVVENASSGHIRSVAKTLRRDGTTQDRELHDVCLAQEVLGDPALRAEYDRLLARLRSAGQPVPKIGVAIEAERLGPSMSARAADAGRAGLQATARFLKGLFTVVAALGVIVLVAVGIGASGGSSSRYGTSFEYKPIKLPDYSKIYIPPPTIDYSKLMQDIKPIELPKLDPSLYKTPTKVPELEPRPKVPKPKRTTAPKPPAKVKPPPAEAPVDILQ